MRFSFATNTMQNTLVIRGTGNLSNKREPMKNHLRDLMVGFVRF